MNRSNPFDDAVQRGTYNLYDSNFYVPSSGFYGVKLGKPIQPITYISYPYLGGPITTHTGYNKVQRKERCPYCCSKGHGDGALLDSSSSNTNKCSQCGRTYKQGFDELYGSRT